MLKKWLTTDFPQDHLNFCLFLFSSLGFMASRSSRSTDPLKSHTETGAGQGSVHGAAHWPWQSPRVSLPAHVLQVCQQHTACQGGTLETLRRLQKSLVLTLPYVFSLQFFDSRGDFCLILEEEKEGSSLQDCLMVLLQLMEKCGSIRHQSQLELSQRLDSSCKTRRSISIVLTILRTEHLGMLTLLSYFASCEREDKIWLFPSCTRRR